MRKRLGAVVAAGLTAVAVPVSMALAAVPAAAAPSPASPLTSLVISKTDGQFSTSAGPNSVTLQCEPTGGTHPTAQDACDKLIAVDGQFDKLTPAFAACPTYWDPVTVNVTGTWRLQPVHYTKTYSNDCVASVVSDYVFRF